MEKFDAITIGNALLDVFLTVQESNIHSKLHEEEQELCFKYGEKIHVDKCEFHLGGNACNVGVGLSRLGFKTSLCVEIGDDVFSQKIEELLLQEPIDIELVKKTKGAPSSFAIGVNYGGERTLFVEHIKRDHKFNLKDVTTQWIYLTSLGVEWKEPYRHVLDYTREPLRPIRRAQGKQAQGKKGVNLAFSPGTHQLEAFDEKTEDKEGKEIIFNVLKATEILFVNKQEAVRISNFKFQISNREDNPEEIKQLLTLLQSMGSRIVSITDGKNGAYSVDESGKIRKIGMFPSKTVERTGAGDAYAVGFLGAIISGLSIEEAMRWGAINAASVVEKVGAQPGLIRKEELEEKLNGSKEFQAQAL